MNIHKILEDDDLEARFDKVRHYVGEMCGQPCGIMDHFNLEKATQSRHKLELSNLSVLVSHYSNNHTATFGPCVLVTLFGNKFGWCLRLELQTVDGPNVYVEALWWEIEKLEELSPHLKKFMKGEGYVKGSVKSFLEEYFGREPELLTGSLLY